MYMNRQQICKQLRIFKKRRYPVSASPLIEEANKAGQMDFAEFTQWERAFLEDKMTHVEIVQMSTWLRVTSNYIVLAKLRKIAVNTPIEKRDWMYSWKFFETMIDAVKVMLKYSSENIKNN